MTQIFDRGPKYIETFKIKQGSSRKIKIGITFDP